MILFELLVGFLKIGLFSFGGAYAAIPLMREVVLSYGWIGEEKLAYMIAVSESTPGPIMVNLATYVGSVTAGVPGAILATFAVVLPAFLIVILLTAVLKNLIENRLFQSILNALKACVIGVILATGVYMILTNCAGGDLAAPDLTAVALTALLGVVYFGSRRFLKKGISPIALIALSGVAGILVYGL